MRSAKGTEAGGTKTASPTSPESAAASNGGAEPQQILNPLWQMLATSVQTKLKIGAADDEYEREADQVADRVMRMPMGRAFSEPPVAASTASVVQRSCQKCGAGVDEAPAISRMPRQRFSLQRAAFRPAQVQRKCAACNARKDASPLTLGRQPLPARIQRACAGCEKEEQAALQRTLLHGSGATNLQRKCAACSEEEAQRKQDSGDGDSHSTASSVESSIQNLQRGGGQPLSDSTRSFMEPRFGQDFSGVRVHSGHDAAATARSINARAFTLGRDVVFNSGEYQPDTPSGQRLLAHELTHVVQQGSAAGPHPVQRSWVPDWVPSVDDARSAAGSALDTAGDVVGAGMDIAGDVAEGAANIAGDVAEGAADYAGDAAGAVVGLVDEDAGQAVNSAIDSAGQAAGDAADWVGDKANKVLDTAGAVGNTVLDGAGAVVSDGPAAAALLIARRMAGALGGSVVVEDGQVTITVPSMQVCPTIPLQFSLPWMGVTIPIAVGVLPLTGVVNLYGMVGVTVGVTPEVSLQVGPCQLKGLKIVIGTSPLSFHATGAMEANLAGGLGGEANVGLRGEVGALIIVPPGIPIPISAVAIEAGLAGFARGIIHQRLNVAGSMSWTGSGFSLVANDDRDIGLAFDAGLAGYGTLEVLGQNLCTLYWPFFEAHDQMTLSTSATATLAVGSGGAAASFNFKKPVVNKVPFSDLPMELDRSVLANDCPLCDFFEALGYPKHLPLPGPHATGPIPNIHPRSPGGRSAECRGACGVDCKTCDPPEDRYECEDDGEGGHVIWHYPNYSKCPTHQGCRTHDACYDWAVSAGEGGLAGVILGPMHRLCDLECACTEGYTVPQCVGWAMGDGGDGVMEFSDPPQKLNACQGECEEDKEGFDSDGNPITVCLPEIILFDGMSIADSFAHETEKIDVWSKDIWVPYVGLVTLSLNAHGTLNASAMASVGPGRLTDFCFSFDPVAGQYSGTTSLRVPATLNAGLTVGGKLSADADWFRLINVASATGGLEASALATFNTELIATVTVACVNGEVQTTADVSLPTCIGAGFRLDGSFELKLISLFTVYSKKWNFVDRQWNKCWGQSINVGAGPAGSVDLDLRSKSINLGDLLDWLLDDDSDGPKPPPGTTDNDIKENPLTTETAKTLPDIKDKLNDPNPNTGVGTVTLLALPSDGSIPESEAGTSMMMAYLTHEHGTGGKASGQNRIRGFEKLPTLSAHGGSGYDADQVFVRGHLLNQKLGGSGQPRNLYPITQKANTPDHSRIEKRVKDLVHGAPHPVVMYGVTATKKAGPRRVDVLGDGTCTYQYIDADFRCTYGTYRLHSDNTIELNETRTETVASRFDEAGFIRNVRDLDEPCPERP